jgi:hypothetical protein
MREGLESVPRGEAHSLNTIWNYKLTPWKNFHFSTPERLD